MSQTTERRSKVGGWPLAAGIAVVLVFLFYIRHILTPFVLAAALAFILTPGIDWLQKRLRLPRWIVAASVYVLVLALFVVPAFLFGGTLARDVSHVATELPQILHKHLAALASFAGPRLGLDLDPDALTQDLLARGRALTQSGTMFTVAGYGVGLLFGLVLFFVVLVYFLISGKRIAAGVFWLVPPEYRGDVNGAAGKILPLLWRYFAGLLAVVIYAAVLVAIVFGAIFQVPHAVLLGLVVGVLELVPLIGPAITFLIVGIIAAQQGDLAAAVGLFGFAIALRLSIDEVVAPLVLGNAARLHPAVIIFAFLTGGALFGIVGLLLAVPVAASIKIVLTIYYAEPVTKRPAPARR